MDGVTEMELQLVNSYLKPRFTDGQLENTEWITEVKDICCFDPDDLVVLSRDQRTEGEWWFISTSTKPPYEWMIAKSGNWEEHLESVKATTEHGEVVWKISVIFCKHGSPVSVETEWRMDQYHLPSLGPLTFLCRLWKNAESTTGTNGGKVIHSVPSSPSSSSSSTTEINVATDTLEEVHEEAPISS